MAVRLTTDIWVAAHMRKVAVDPDLWVVEIEDRDGRHFLDDPIL